MRRKLRIESLETRQMLAGHMEIGMNLENVVDWSPAWTFTDVFQNSRPWVPHDYNTVTRQSLWQGTQPIQLDSNGWPTQLARWTNAQGQAMEQRLGTLMFVGLNGQYPGGTYRAEWEGTATITFGMDARVVQQGRTPEGLNFANLNVTPTHAGIYVRIDAMNTADPLRNMHVWMPDYNGESFAGERWQPGADFSPFHPLFTQRLESFGVVRFMQWQETNTSDIVTWEDRRDADDARQRSGMGATPVTGVAVEYMVELANELGSDPWFNMPHMADDDFVRHFAEYVRDHLRPDLTAYVEWSNEIWNFAFGFEGTQWVAEQTRLPENVGLSHWQIAGREAKRDLDIWSEVFAGQSDRVVRVAGGFAANDWITARIVENMGGSFDAIAIAPYIGPTGTQRAAYTSATTVDQVLADTRANISSAVNFTLNHQRLADQYSRQFGRDVKLLSYEGGTHLDGRNAPYQNAFYQAGNDPRMQGILEDYLRNLEAAGMDLYVHYKFTDRPLVTQWGDFGVLHRQDEPLSSAPKYASLVDAALGSLFDEAAPLAMLAVSDAQAAEAPSDTGAFRVTRGNGDLSQPLTVNYTIAGTAAGSDFQLLSGSITIPSNERTAMISIVPVDDVLIEAPETVILTLASGSGYEIGSARTGTVTISSEDRAASAPSVNVTASDAAAAEQGADRGVFTLTRSGGSTAQPLTIWFALGGTAVIGADYAPLVSNVTIPAGSVSATVNIVPINDTAIESLETVTLTINESLAYRFGSSRQASLTIASDDGVVVPPSLPTISIAATDDAMGEAGMNAGTFTLNRTGDSTASVIVQLQTSGSATAGDDYSGAVTSVTIPAGAASASFTLTPVDDNRVETAETVSMTVVGHASYQLGTQIVATATIADNDVVVAPLPVLIVIANRDFYYQEYNDTRRALEAAGMQVVVAAERREIARPHYNSGQGTASGEVMPNLALTEARAADYSTIVFVGGWGASAYQYGFSGTYNNSAYNGTLAVREAANRLIGEFLAQDKYVTAICHGVSALAWARVNGVSPLASRTVVGYGGSAPASNVAGSGTSRWHVETNSAVMLPSRSVGDRMTAADDVYVDGRIITAENWDSATRFGQIIAERVRA